MSVLCLMSCGSSFGPSTENKPIPPLDPRDAQPCVDASVEGSIIEIAANARKALAQCKDKHENVVEQYEDVREQFGP